MTERPTFIRHWRTLEDADDAHYPGDTELLGLGAAVGRATGLTRIGIHHERLPPGRRSCWPHAESLEEEFVFVIDGYPDVWIDGVLYPLEPGDSVGFPAGTGMSHTFLNNTDAMVSLLVLGEANKPENRIHYPLHQAYQQTRTDGWTDVPSRDLGPHDGKPRAGTRKPGGSV